ncbi:hypothetical protein VTO73DRAFT_6926 [Trametes versicolor]
MDLAHKPCGVHPTFQQHQYRHQSNHQDGKETGPRGPAQLRDAGADEDDA